MKLTDEQCEQNDNISTREIEVDILDTQAEIDQYQKEIEAMSSDKQNNKLEIYMREGKISARRDFINTLNSILDYRSENINNQS